jgi:SNF family Na+-dependent transporter
MDTQIKNHTNADHPTVSPMENAREGVKLLWATWRSNQLANPTVWQTAVGQVFFSTGIGFGYFTTYASYNQKHSNAVGRTGPYP